MTITIGGNLAVILMVIMIIAMLLNYFGKWAVNFLIWPFWSIIIFILMVAHI